MEVVKLYDGEVTLAFEPERHIYRVTDPQRELVNAKLPSVTGILGVINKPALVGWASNMAANYVRDHWKPGRAYTEVEIADIVRGARKAYTERRDKSADEGTIIHQYIEDYIHYKLGLRQDPPDKPIEPRIFEAINGFHEWEDQHEVHFLLSEQKLYSRRYGFVGTADILMHVDGTLTIGDIKTGKYVYPEYGLQMAAYWYALTEQGSVPEDEFIEQGIIIRIGREGTGIEVATLLPDPMVYLEYLRGFAGAVDLYHWKRKYGEGR